MAKNVDLQLLGINSSPPSAYSDYHSFGQQCFTDDLRTTTGPKCAEHLSESSQSQPKKPHQRSKTNPSEKINHTQNLQVLMTAQAIHHQTANHSRHLQVLKKAKASHQRMANLSRHSRVLTRAKAIYQIMANHFWHLSVLTRAIAIFLTTAIHPSYSICRS